MRPSARPRKTANLSDSIQHRLNAYALAASAAGVGVLALTQAAEARIVYTPANENILPVTQVFLDLNHDGIPDFSFWIGGYTFGVVSCRHHSGDHGNRAFLRINPLNQNGVRGKKFASAFPAGVRIGPKGQSIKNRYGYMATYFFCDSTMGGTAHYYFGPWANGGKGVKRRYLGLKFVSNGEVHFGWARLNVSVHGGHVKGLLTGYAYETIPNKPIITGKTKGPDDGANDDPGPGASAANPIPEIPQPASLGALAMGSSGLSIWRRKEWAGQGN